MDRFVLLFKGHETPQKKIHTHTYQILTHLFLQEGCNLALCSSYISVYAIHHLQQLLLCLLAGCPLALGGLLHPLLVVLYVVVAVDVLQVGAQSGSLGGGAQDGAPGGHRATEEPAVRAHARVGAIGCLRQRAIAPGDVDEESRPLDDGENGVVGGKVAAGEFPLLVVALRRVVVGTGVVVVGIGVATGVHDVRLVVAPCAVPAVSAEGGVWFEVAVLGPEVG